MDYVSSSYFLPILPEKDWNPLNVFSGLNRVFGGLQIFRHWYHQKKIGLQYLTFTNFCVQDPNVSGRKS